MDKAWVPSADECLSHPCLVARVNAPLAEGEDGAKNKGGTHPPKVIAAALPIVCRKCVCLSI